MWCSQVSLGFTGGLLHRLGNSVLVLVLRLEVGSVGEHLPHHEVGEGRVLVAQTTHPRGQFDHDPLLVSVVRLLPETQNHYLGT